MTDTVTHYGVHRTPQGVVYLHQGNHKAANFIGLSATSPFHVESGVTKQKACPHQINVGTPMPDREHWKAFREILKDDLTSFFLPIPRHFKDPIPYITDGDDMLLLLLSKLSSPVYPVVHRFEKFKLSRLESELVLTNVTPLVLTHIETKHQAQLEHIMSVARGAPRRLILSGEENMVIRSPMFRLKTYLDTFDQTTLYSLPMENLGAVSLRRWARGEVIDSEWVRQ